MGDCGRHRSCRIFWIRRSVRVSGLRGIDRCVRPSLSSMVGESEEYRFCIVINTRWIIRIIACGRTCCPENSQVCMHRSVLSDQWSNIVPSEEILQCRISGYGDHMVRA